MSEGARTASPYQLRDLFVTFLNNCFAASPKGLWEHSWKSMSDDILHKRQRILGHANLELDDNTLEQYTLIEVEKLMRMQDRSLNDFKDMPKINPVLLKELGNSLYRVELLVDDGNDNATFVVFDREMLKLTKQDAAGLNLDEIRVTPFNFSSSHRTFTVSAIINTIGPETFKTNAAEFVPVEGGQASATGSNMTGGEEKEPNPSDAGGKGSSRKRPRE
ncbi:hypothetical protein F2Q70_00039675 [Brassica cretica]|uniref:Replication factor A C-terminal domain-containing protein n=1 Tax=Brassica cretica TaxID=69181 RepID=A0A8S9K5Q4_BRACR|nr:hypothetical protein F2Q70_00039675 [Brassica cretica]